MTVSGCRYLPARSKHVRHSREDGQRGEGQLFHSPRTVTKHIAEDLASMNLLIHSEITTTKSESLAFSFIHLSHAQHLSLPRGRSKRASWNRIHIH
jgi:hypothetical protein